MSKQRAINIFDILAIIPTPEVGSQSGLFREERLEKLHPGGGGGEVYHSLVADVFVRPDAPRDATLAINLQLCLQKVASPLIDLLMLCIGCGSVDRAEFTIPDGDPVLAHEFDFSVEGTLEIGVLACGASILFAHWEPHHAVVVHGVDRVGEHGFEMCEIHCIRISVQEKNVVWIN